MKNNVAQKEFGRLKNQIAQIEQIVKNSKGNAFIEHETVVRKKILLLEQMDKEFIKDYDKVYERYQELLTFIGIKLIEDYNKKQNLDEIVINNGGKNEQK